MQNNLIKLLESGHFHKFVAFLLFINAIILGLETSQTIKISPIHSHLLFLDNLFLLFFTVEISLRFLCIRGRFFKNSWNTFDVVVVGISVIAYITTIPAFQALRILRVLRIIELFPHMRLVVKALTHALPGIFNVMLILLVLYYVSAVVVTNIFANEHLDLFGDLSSSMATLFQLMIADGWGEVMQKLTKTHPYAIWLFVIYMFAITFTVLNLFIGLIVNGMQKAAESESNDIDTDTQTLEELKKIRHELEELKNKLLP